MTDRNGSVRQILLGVVLSSILIGIDVRPVQAQLTVFDPSQYALQVAKKIDEAAR